jgi:hypothetical protein
MFVTLSPIDGAVVVVLEVVVLVVVVLVLVVVLLVVVVDELLVVDDVVLLVLVLLVVVVVVVDATTVNFTTSCRGEFAAPAATTVTTPVDSPTGRAAVLKRSVCAFVLPPLTPLVGATASHVALVANR